MRVSESEGTSDDRYLVTEPCKGHGTKKIEDELLRDLTKVNQEIL